MVLGQTPVTVYLNSVETKTRYAPSRLVGVIQHPYDGAGPVTLTVEGVGQVMIPAQSILYVSERKKEAD